MTPLLLAFAAGALYGISALFFKRALDTGAGTFRSLAYSNWLITLIFIPYPFLAEQAFTYSTLANGLLLGLLFFTSQAACFLALRRGEASVITPILGSKSLFVAVFIVLLGFKDTLPSETWWAAGLAGIAVVLLGWPAKNYRPSLVGLGLAILTAAGFGLTDALVPHFAKTTDPFHLHFVMVATVGLLSVFLIPISQGSFLGWRKEADKWLLLGSIPMALQAMLMSIAIGFFDVPTEANVFYASRGLWSILFVAWLGSFIGISEGSAPKGVLVRRILGAALLLAGIYLAPPSG
jgi:drug/metabolite transporter (DMT)-like permease